MNDPREFWNAPNTISTEYEGVFPMGAGGLFETRYRNYLEIRHLKKIILFNKDMYVLEHGCGYGRWIKALAPLVRKYVAVDFSHRAIEEAKKIPGLSNVEFHEQPITEFRSGRIFDIVYFGSVIQYLQDNEFQSVIGNMQEYTCPSTIVIDRSSVDYQQRRTVTTPNGYLVIYRTPEEICFVMESYGWKRVYEKRSHTFLRGSRVCGFGPVQALLLALSDLTPLTFLVLEKFSQFMDWVYPVDYEGSQSHDFLVFRK
jgi:SAM-dependent methyltransferase